MNQFSSQNNIAQVDVSHSCTSSNLCGKAGQAYGTGTRPRSESAGFHNLLGFPRLRHDVGQGNIPGNEISQNRFSAAQVNNHVYLSIMADGMVVGLVTSATISHAGHPPFLALPLSRREACVLSCLLFTESSTIFPRLCTSTASAGVSIVPFELRSRGFAFLTA